MPDSQYGTRRVLCPFWKGQDPMVIKCESPIDDTTINSTRFLLAADQRRQREIFCEHYYKRCEIYRSIMQNRYPERNDEE